MNKKVLLAIGIAACLLAGCGKDDGPESLPAFGQPVGQGTEEQSKESTVDSSEESSAETPSTEESNDPGQTFKYSGEENPITERVEKDGKMQSYLTGEWKDTKVVQRRNFAVMIPNNLKKVPGSDVSKTVPQHGLSKASIIYEAPVEGRITRLMAIFEDYDDLEVVGPIRSSRDYFVYEAMAYDSIYCNWGLAVPYVAPIINTDRIDNISQAVSGIEVSATEAFGRDLNPGYAQEFTSSMRIAGYEKAVKRLKYATTYKEHGKFKQAFTFADEGYIAVYEKYPDATTIWPGGTDGNKGGYGNYKGDNAIRFEYNAEDHLYYRFQYGDPQVDADNNEQLAVTNVVFKVCHGEVRDDHDYLAFGVHGTGTAYVFTNGKVIKGTWKRTGDPDPEVNIFYDENGKEIVFNQGKTWICNIWDDYEKYIKYE